MIKIISAGAGSGKTYRLTEEMVQLLRGGTRASGIIATTFTAKAAAELQERVRTKLLEEGLTEQANDLSNALIGTVHGLGVKLLKRFAFEAGVSPKVDIIADEDSQILFNRSLSQILNLERVETLNALCDRLGMSKKGGTYDWRKDIRSLVEVARANAFSKEILEISKVRSFESFKIFLTVEEGTNVPSDGWKSSVYNKKLDELLTEVIQNLEGNGDETKVTDTGKGELKTIRNELRQREHLHWHQWVKIEKIKVGAKSKDQLEELQEFAAKHVQFNDFQIDIQNFIFNLFDIVIEALAEYERYKKQRGLIDYTDMEVLVRTLLNNPSVKEVLRDELDLLMVDEFQDTSPMQLDIFLKLSNIAKDSIWVGDPKQSIYGFRGAEPRLMQAIIEKIGIKNEDILKDSWRSRPEIVAATNAIFTKSFDHLPTEQVALNAKRKDGNLQTEALIHWQFNFENGGDARKKQPGSPWTEECIAESIKTTLERRIYIQPKGEKELRPARAGDFAVLCRTNDQCQAVTNALNRAGLKAAMARMGLLETAEAKLILAVLRYILNKHDSLSVAEILLLAEKLELSEIIEHRLAFLERIGEGNYDWSWATENDFIFEINKRRRDTIELSANEILNLILEELDLRRIISTWGNASQRLENVDVIRSFSLKYEETCNRLHTAASLGGFLLWLANLAENETDKMSSGEGSDAVNVLTYHRSKGLEYPVVVMGNLEQNLRDSVFGIAIETLDTEGGNAVNLDDILSNRWLRFWVNPYADQLKNTALDERVNASEAKAKATLAALGEEARLLYVGVTRARDYLIFPTSQTPTKWLNRAWHKGKEDFPTFDVGNDTPFDWQGKEILKDYEEFYYEKDFPYVEPSDEQILFIEGRSGKGDFLNYKIDLNTEYLVPENQYSVQNIAVYAPILPLKEDVKQPLILKALNAYMTGFVYKSAHPNDNFELAKQISERFLISEMIDIQLLMKQTQSFYNFLHNDFKVKKLSKRYPIKSLFDDRLFETEVDILIEHTFKFVTDAEVETSKSAFVLIFNSDYYGDPKKVKSETAKQATKLYLAKKTVSEVFNTPYVRCFVHFLSLGNIVEVTF